MEDKQGAILAHFERGGALTVLDALRLYHTTELRRIVSRLKNAGYDIQSSHDDGCNYKRYFLQQEQQCRMAI